MTESNSYLLSALASYLKAELYGDPNYCIAGLSTLAKAGSSDLAFLANHRYQKYLAETNAGCVLLDPAMSTAFTGNKLVVADPYLAFARLTALFRPAIVAPGEYDGANIHASAAVHASATVAVDALVGPQAVIERDVTIASGAIIGAGCFIGRGSAIGKNSQLHANVTINYGTQIGSDVIVHSGAVIAADGFGFARDGQCWQKIYQLGGVVIEDSVEIGACSTVDRGALGDTVLEAGVKIDNQVQIAHNVRVGAHTAIAGCVGIAGSTVIGKRCTIAGAVGISGHLTIADDVHITAMTMVTRSIAEAGSYSSGILMLPTPQWRKNAVRFNQLDNFVRRTYEKLDK